VYVQGLYCERSALKECIWSARLKGGIKVVALVSNYAASVLLCNIVYVSIVYSAPRDWLMPLFVKRKLREINLTQLSFLLCNIQNSPRSVKAFRVNMVEKHWFVSYWNDLALNYQIN